MQPFRGFRTSHTSNYIMILSILRWGAGGLFYIVFSLFSPFKLVVDIIFILELAQIAAIIRVSELLHILILHFYLPWGFRCYYLMVHSLLLAIDRTRPSFHLQLFPPHPKPLRLILTSRDRDKYPRRRKPCLNSPPSLVHDYPLQTILIIDGEA